MQVKESHEHWSSRLGFILAAVGAAVGLGNFWRFPYTAGENGGGAFVLVYIFCVVAVAFPILMAELLIGRRGGMSAVGSTRKVAVEDGHSGAWQIVGWIGMIGGFLILTYYSVIAGWIIAYTPDAAMGHFKNITAEASAARFDRLLADPWLLMLCHGIFMILTVYIVSRGIAKGIEVAVDILMPMFFIMLMGVVAYSWVTGDIGRALSFLFTPDFSKITPAAVLDAIGQAFFSIGVGAAIMLTYGSYLTSETRIPFASGVICFADTLVAVLAGIAIFPIVFAVGLDPASGPGLIFVTLPVAFGQMPFGAVFATVFFALALFAALTSSISLLEIMVSWADERAGWPRRRTSYIVGFVAWLIGLGSVFSFNIWSDLHLLKAFETFKTMTIFDLLDYLTSNLLLPLDGVLIALFAGWILSRKLTLEELGLSDGRVYRMWRFLVRYVAPIGVGAVLIYSAFLSA